MSATGSGDGRRGFMRLASGLREATLTATGAFGKGRAAVAAEEG